MAKCSENVSKFILVTVNLIFFIGSAIMFGFGITAKVKPESITTVFSYCLPPALSDDIQHAGVDITDIVVSNAAYMIAVGFIGIMIAGIGFLGACCMAKCMLALYACLMILLLLAQVGLVIFAYFYPTTFKQFIQQNMETTLKGFNSEIRINSTYAVVMPAGVVELGWANVQIKEKCCGARNWTDYSSMNWINHGLVPSSVFSGLASVPISCCRQKSTADGHYPPKYDEFVDIAGCLAGDARYINQQNCYDAIEDDIEIFIRDHRGIAIGIASGIVAVELILIITAIILHRTQRKYVKFV